MTRLVGQLATLAAVLVLMTACAGAPPAPTTNAPPNPTQRVSTPAAVGTPETTGAPPAASSGSADTLDTGLDWPTTVNTTLSTGTYEKEFAEGSFSSSANASQCGPTVLFPNGFLFGFPHDINGHDIEDVSFSAHQLVPGSSTSSFSISVSISEAAAGARAKTFLDTDDMSSGASGTAQLSVVNGARHLVVDAADDGGVSVHLIAVCSPA
jgi:hypothetical protein